MINEDCLSNDWSQRIIIPAFGNASHFYIRCLYLAGCFHYGETTRQTTCKGGASLDSSDSEGAICNHEVHGHVGTL